MKTTNKFKYSFIMIGYIAFLSLAQHAKAYDTQVINADGSLTITGSASVLTGLPLLITRDKFLVFCQLPNIAGATNPTVRMAINDTGLVSGTTFDALLSSGNDIKTLRGDQNTGRAIYSKNPIFFFQVQKTGLANSTYTATLRCTYDISGVTYNNPFLTFPANNASFLPNSAYLYQVGFDTNP